MMKKILATTLTFLITIGALFGASGTTSFSFLEIGKGAKSSAMANASVASLATFEGVTHNPASIASIAEDLTVFTSYNPNVASMAIWNLGGTYNAGVVTLGISLSGLTFLEELMGHVEYSGDNGRALDLGNFGFTISAGMSLDTLVAIPVVDLDLGASFNVVSETLDQDSLTGVGIDFGVIASMKETIPMSTLALGVWLKNAGAGMVESGADISLPTGVVVGVGYTIAPSDTIYINVLADTDLTFSSDPQINVGVEAGILNIAYVRAGTVLDLGSTVAVGVTGGVGTKFSVNDAMSLGIDYAISSVGGLALGMKHDIQLSFSYSFPKEESDADGETDDDDTDTEE